MKAWQVGKSIVIGIGSVCQSSITKGGIAIASAASNTVSVGVGHIDEGSNEGHVQDYDNERDQAYSSETAEQKEAGQSVEDGCAGDAFNSSHLSGSGYLVVAKCRQEV